MTTHEQYDLKNVAGRLKTGELREWLEAERAVVQRFVTNPTLDADSPAARRGREASARVKVIEAELDRRSSGRLEAR